MPFTFQIQTTSNGQTFGFVTDNAVNLYVDWGDSSNNTYSGTATRTHAYSTAGIYNVSLNGQATRIAFYGTGATPTLLKDILTKMSDGLTGITSGNSMFRGCTQITTFTEPAFFDDVSVNVTTLERMFNAASSFNMDLNGWDTSKVTLLTHTFSVCTLFNGDISSWNTSSVTNMDGTFYNAKAFNQPIGNWDTSKVVYFNTAYEGTFQGASSFNQPLNNWNTSSATNMYKMFYGATSFNGNISNWNTSKVTTMAYMFNGATAFNQPLDDWDTSKVTSMNSMFKSTANFNQSLNSWDTSKVTDMAALFQFAPSFNGNISSWNTSSVTTMASMFSGATAFNQSIGNWNTSKVTNMQYMFEGATSFNKDISNWNVSSVTSANQMFSGVTLPTVVYDGILIKWSKQTLQSGVTISFGSSKYDNGLPLESKNKIASNFTWTITDGGSTGITYVDNKRAKIKEIFPKGLVSYWSMDSISGNTLIDEKGTNNGTIYGATQTTGIKGNALNFDGVDDYVDVGTISSLTIGEKSFSLWVKVANIPSSAIIFVHRPSKAGLGFYNGNIILGSGSTGDNVRMGDDSNFDVGGWNHLVVNYNLSNIPSFYLNGLEQNYISENYWTESVNKLLIGKRSTGTNFKGLIDEVMIFNRALSEDEINKLYKMGLSKLKLKVNGTGNKLSEGLVSYWSMDSISGNTLNDYTGINNGTIYGATQVDGMVGKALSFDGVDDYVDCGNNVAGNSNMTISFWINPSANQQGGLIYKTAGYSNALEDYHIFWWTGIQGIQIGFSNGSVITYNNLGGSGIIIINEWQLITVVKTGTKVDVYRNSVFSGSANNYPVNVQNTATPLIIGKESVLPQRKFKGKLDEVMFFNRALSLEEIQQLYNQGLGKYNPFYNKIEINVRKLDRSSVVGYWSMDNISGTTLYDEMGANNGTIYGATQVGGKIGNALNFDGVDDYVTFGKNFVGSMDKFSVSHWIYLDSSQKTRTIFSNYTITSGPNGWVTGISDVENNKVKFYLGAGNTLYSSYALDIKKWYHVVVTYDAGNPKIYINSTLDASSSGSIAFASTYNNNTIGCLGSNLAQKFDGYIDEVMLFNRALSPDEISYLYNSGKGKYYPI